MPTLTLTGDASGAVKATSDVGAAAQKLDRDFKQVLLTTDQLREQMQKAFDEKPIDRYIRKCEEMAQKVAAGKMTMSQYVEQTERLAMGLKQTGVAQEQSFGSAAANNLASYAAGMLSIGTAVSFVTSALREQNEEKQRAAALDGASLGAAGQLSAAGGTKDDLEYARQLHAQGIVKDDDEGMRAVTGMLKADLGTDDREYLADLADQQLVAPGSMGDYAQNVQVYRKSFGEEDAGSFQDAEKKLRFAGRDTRLGAETIALQMAKVAPVAKEAGLSDEEAMAALVVQSNRSADKKQATSETIDRIKSGDMFSGDADAAAEYATEVQRLQSAPTSPDAESLVRTDPRLRAADAAGDAKSARDADMAQNTSETTSLYNTLRSRRSVADREKYGYGFRGAMNEAGLGIGDKVNRTFGREEAEIRHAAEDLTPAEQQERGLSREDVALMKDYLKRIADSAERSDRSVPVPSGRQE